ncbi:MAG: potassium transporter TrkA, partial [Myxococcota bacterium]
MVPSISLLLILGTSMILTRIAAVALEHTGLSQAAARFQARSAFTGTGFTTAEAEQVVGHPVRRRIIMWLMLVGNVGIVSAMAALLLSAIDLRTEQG